MSYSPWGALGGLSLCASEREAKRLVDKPTGRWHSGDRRTAEDTHKHGVAHSYSNALDTICLATKQWSRRCSARGGTEGLLQLTKYQSRLASSHDTVCFRSPLRCYTGFLCSVRRRWTLFRSTFDPRASRVRRSKSRGSTGLSAAARCVCAIMRQRGSSKEKGRRLEEKRGAQKSELEERSERTGQRGRRRPACAHASNSHAWQVTPSIDRSKKDAPSLIVLCPFVLLSAAALLASA